jgi:hypothetical protein
MISHLILAGAMLVTPEAPDSSFIQGRQWVLEQPQRQIRLESGNERVRVQLELRQRQYFERDRTQFTESDEVIFITPTNRPKHKNGSTRILLGVVFKF